VKVVDELYEFLVLVIDLSNAHGEIVCPFHECHKQE